MEREWYLAELLATYDDVLSDELKQKPMNTHGPMRVHLMRGGKPYRTATARRVLLRFEEQADRTLDELKQMGVITEINEPTAWCSPAFWEPKPHKVRVRLVTDFTNLNRVVKRQRYTPSRAPQKFYKPYQRMLGCLPSWTQYTGTSS